MSQRKGFRKQSWTQGGRYCPSCERVKAHLHRRLPPPAWYRKCAECLAHRPPQDSVRQRARRYKTDEADLRERIQRGLCELCGRSIAGRDIMVDHDHATGYFRGVLCGGCNTGLGFFRDDVALMQRAIDYLTSRRIDWPWLINEQNSKK